MNNRAKIVAFDRASQEDLDRLDKYLEIENGEVGSMSNIRYVMRGKNDGEDWESRDYDNEQEILRDYESYRDSDNSLYDLRVYKLTTTEEEIWKFG